MPLLIPSLGWLVGLAIARVDFIPYPFVMALSLMLAVSLILRYRRTLAITMLAGIAWGSLSLFWDAYRVSYDEGWLKRDLSVTALVESVTSSPTSLRLTLDRVVRSDGATLPGRVDLYLYGAGRDSAIHAGERISSTLSLHLPSNRLNPGAFDYRTYCFDRHIALIGSSGEVQLIGDERSWLQRARERVLQYIPERQGGSVVRALLLADRSAIPADIQDAFAASGAAHLLAISGLHVGMVAGWAFIIAWWLLTRREAWIVAVPVRRVALLCGLSLALFYATLAGWPISAQRSAVMLAASVLAWWLRSRAEPLNTMLAALMFLLFIDPAAVASVSLWLSFAAVAALLLWMESGAVQLSGKRRLRQWAAGLFWVSLVASLATLPIITDMFGRIPTWSLVANLLLVPLYSLIVLPLALIGELLAIFGAGAPAVYCFEISAASVEAGNRLLQQMQLWPGGNLWVPDVSMAAGLLYAAGMAITLRFLIRESRRGAFVAMIATLALYLLLAVPERSPQMATFTVWDVGQGAASSLSMPDGWVMVIDSPGRFGSRYNGGNDVAEGLRSNGTAHADVLVLSHAQSDHAGGAERLIAGLGSVRQLWLADVPASHDYRPMQLAAERIMRQGGAVRWLKRGDHASLGDVDIEVLWPPAGYQPLNGNNASLVLSLTLPGGERILLPGDIEHEVEERLAGELAACDLALLPHHGSRTSSSVQWVKSAAPKIAVAQTGRDNRYHFPAADVVGRYRMQGSQLFDSKYGAVSVRFAEEGSGAIDAGQYRPEYATKRETALQWWQGAL